MGAMADLLSVIGVLVFFLAAAALVVGLERVG